MTPYGIPMPNPHELEGPDEDYEPRGTVQCPICGDTYVPPGGPDPNPAPRCPTCGSPALPYPASPS